VFDRRLVLEASAQRYTEKCYEESNEYSNIKNKKAKRNTKTIKIINKTEE
jgi:hypothetical protein